MTSNPLSSQPSDQISLSDEELKSLTNAIQQRHGIDFGCYEPKSLKRRVIRAMTVFKFSSVHELWIKILREHAFIYKFMDEISVGLTAMFRDPILWKKLKGMLGNEFRGKDIKIWHAGCSSGEEVYTMGIVISEANFKGNVAARATDISKQAIDTAMKGEYHKMKLDEYEQNFKTYNPMSSLKNYYVDGPTSVTMKNSLIKHVTFEYHNLIKDRFDNNYDIIFCRNVMIYFDNKTKLGLFEKFHQSLKPGGLLIIGFYDAVLPLIDETKFKILDIDTKVFQKIT